jgi:hypothetical protein
MVGFAWKKIWHFGTIKQVTFSVDEIENGIDCFLKISGRNVFKWAHDTK